MDYLTGRVYAGTSVAMLNYFRVAHKVATRERNQERAGRDAEERRALHRAEKNSAALLKKGRERIAAREFKDAVRDLEEGLQECPTSCGLMTENEANLFAKHRWDLEAWLAVAQIRLHLQKKDFAEAASFLSMAREYQPARDYPTRKVTRTKDEKCKEGMKILFDAALIRGEGIASPQTGIIYDDVQYLELVIPGDVGHVRYAAQGQSKVVQPTDPLGACDFQLGTRLYRHLGSTLDTTGKQTPLVVAPANLSHSRSGNAPTKYIIYYTLTLTGNLLAQWPQAAMGCWMHSTRPSKKWQVGPYIYI